MKATFFRIIEADDKAATLREAIAEHQNPLRFDVDPVSFSDVPRSPFAYWVNESTRRLFVALPALESGGRIARVTNPAGDDTRFFRAAWEVPDRQYQSTGQEDQRWVPLAKGGAYSPYYADIHLVVDWDPTAGSYRGFLGTPHRPLVKPASLEHFFRPGLTWPRRTTSGLSLRAMPAGCIFADKGPAAFVEANDPEELLGLLALVNSRPFRVLVELQLAAADAAARSYEVGVLQRTPIPELKDPARIRLANLALRAWSVKRSLDTETETSHAFLLPALLQREGGSMAERAGACARHMASVQAELSEIQREIDETCYSLYGIDGEDRGRIEEGFGAVADDSAELGTDDEDGNEPEEIDTAPLVAYLLSWSLGVAFGRFDVRLVTDDQERPAEPEPFDPLPPCSPGMLAGDDGLPLDVPSPGNSIDVPRDGVLVDDIGHERDLVARVRQTFQVVFGEDSDAAWREAAEILDGRSRSVRSWLAGSFSEDHIKYYSKSRRKAPIYWQLATPSTRYSVWLYYHRFTRDTAYLVLNDYVTPKLQHEERKLTSMAQDAGPNPSAGQRKENDAQEGFVVELRAFRDEMASVAPLWKPNLNDGVIINFAPLWRLVPQNRAWQKECKACWDKLCRGDYDWAQLAMHLWPERVVPKCAEDRSLAIAHGLEEVFWYEDSKGKWQPRKADQADVDRLVKERTSAAVKDALKSLLEAPSPSGGRVRGAGSRKKSSAWKTRARSSAESSPVAKPNPSSPAPRTLDPDLLTRVKKAIAANGDRASKADVIEATGITSGQWSTAIKALLADGSVTQTGERRGARYHQAGGEA